jgi:phytoene synthase
MCHVLGVRRESAVLNGVHLGMGMQLTNICRDVAEDWARGRLYVPAELLAGYEAPDSWPPPARTLDLLARGVERLLQQADVFYRSGDRGLLDLSPRNRLAVATARHVYSSIGHRLRARHCDVSQGRVAVPLHHKLGCVARAALACVRAGASADQSRVPQRVVRFPEDVLPV